MTSSYRTLTRRVSFDVDIQGDPVIWQYPRDGARRVLVDYVRLEFHHGDDGYNMQAFIVGTFLFADGKPGKLRADDYAGDHELWPDWLRAIADEHRPDGYVAHSGPLGGAI